MNAQEGDKNCQKERLKEERKKTNGGLRWRRPQPNLCNGLKGAAVTGQRRAGTVGSKNEPTLLPGRLGFEGPGEV